MADDKNNELDPEEENNDPFEDDDFGLPDLEYDELDDDEFEDEFGTEELVGELEDSADADEGVSADASEELDDALTVDDTFGDIEEEGVTAEDAADDLDDLEEDLNPEDFGTLEDLDDDIESDEFDLSEEDLQKELEELENEELDFSDIEDLDEGGSDTDDEFYEQESFDDFSDDNVLDSVFGDDDGDPDVKSEQVLVSGSANSGIQRDVSAKEKAASQYAQAYADSQNQKGKFGRIVIIGTVVIMLVAAGLWMMTGDSTGEKQVAKKEQPKPKPKPKPQPKEEAPKEEAKPTPQPAPQRTAAPSTVAAGTVNELTERTGKAYIVIASFVDGDLAKDHADKLAADGKSPYVIPPFNNGLYYRVAIAEFQTFADATQNIGSYKEEHGQDIWTLRY